MHRLGVAGLLSLFCALAAAPSAGAALELSPVQRIEANGAALGYRTAGSGPPLVLVMGFGGTMAEWDPALLEALAARRTVVIFDNRGMGESTGASVAGLTIRRMARDAAALIAAVTGGGRADVLGWSMGGYIAQELALNHPNRVRRLILAGSDAGGPRARSPKRSVTRLLEDQDATPEDLVRILFPARSRQSGLDYIQRVIALPGGFTANSFNAPPESVRAQERAAGPRWNGPGRGTYGRLPRLRKRTLVAGALEDVVVPPANSRMLAERIPGARLRLYRRGGHAFLFQLRDRFAGAVLRFLTARRSRQASAGASGRGTGQSRRCFRASSCDRSSCGSRSPKRARCSSSWGS